MSDHHFTAGYCRFGDLDQQGNVRSSSPFEFWEHHLSQRSYSSRVIRAPLPGLLATPKHACPQSHRISGGLFQLRLQAAGPVVYSLTQVNLQTRKAADPSDCGEPISPQTPGEAKFKGLNSLKELPNPGSPSNASVCVPRCCSSWPLAQQHHYLPRG